MPRDRLTIHRKATGRRSPTSWEAYLARVRKAAEPAMKRKPHHGPVENLRPYDFPLQHPAPDERRCTAITSKGARCKRWTIAHPDATLCVLHGGLREAPEARATIRAYKRGAHEDQNEHKQAVDVISKTFAKTHPDIVETVRRELKSRHASRHGAVQLAGCHALAMADEDGGKAWRRFLSTLPARQEGTP